MFRSSTCDRLIHHPWLAPALVLAMAVVVFGGVLLDGERVVSQEHNDLWSQFLYWRDFGFSQLRSGNLPMWNPHSYGGQPYFPGLHAAMAYPLNWLYLIDAVGPMTNLSVALHIALAGLFTERWAYARKLDTPARVLAAAVVMFGGATFLRVYAGHITMITSAAWIPLVLLSVEKLLAQPNLRWILIGSAAAGMELLAGYPQLAYYTAIAGGLYALLALHKAPQPARSIGALFVMAAIGGALSAVEILPAYGVAHESTRAGSSFAFASTFPFTPESFVSLFAPSFFGDGDFTPYWGRWYAWEENAFVGVTALSLAVLGCTAPSTRSTATPVFLLLVLFALGKHTPLFAVLFDYLPLFDRFRGTGKFMGLAVFYLALLAGTGLQRLLDGELQHRLRMSAVVIGCLAIPLSAVGLLIGASNLQDVTWRQVVRATRETGEVYPLESAYDLMELVERSSATASESLLLAAATMILLGALLWAAVQHRRAVSLIAVLGVLELLVFARLSLPTFALRDAYPENVARALERYPGDHRVHLFSSNLAMPFGQEDIWGYNPVVSRRWSELISYTQGVHPDAATYHLKFVRPSPLFRMLRLKVVLRNSDLGVAEIQELPPPLPRVLLIDRYRVIRTRDLRLAALAAPDFDPEAEVLLESDPDPPPVAGARGTARVRSRSTDTLTIEVDLPEPAILLVTDSYASSWQARDGQGSSFEVLPANHALRAIALPAGRRVVELEYRPRNLALGAGISTFALAFLLLGLFVVRRVSVRSRSRLA